MTQSREATTYLQVRAGRYHSQATVVNATTKKPSVVQPGCIVVKVKLRLPREAWDPFEPEAVIDVPADLIQYPIDVTAVDPE